MTFSRHRRSLFAALVAAVALIAAGCGGGERVVVSNPVVEPVDAAAVADPPDPEPDPAPVDEGSIELPTDFEFDFGGASDGETDDTEALVDDGADEGALDTGSGEAFNVSSLKSVAATTEASSSYRFEVWLDWVMADPTFSLSISPDVPLATGTVAAGASSYAADLGPFMTELFSEFGEEDLIRELFGGDLTMQVIDDGAGRLYVYAPLIASLSGDASMPDSFAALGTGWGVVDLNRIDGVDAADLASLTGAQGGSSPEAILDLLRSAGSVEELGRADVRGVATDHLRVGVTLGQLIDAQGTDLGDLEGFAGDLDAVLGVAFPFDLFVDDDGRVRRVTLTIDLESIEAMIGEAAPAGTTFSMSTVMDFFDYDDPGIAVNPPADADVVVDLTDDLDALFG